MNKIIKTWQERKAADPAHPPSLAAGDDSYYRNCETMDLRAYIEELEEWVTKFAADGDALAAKLDACARPAAPVVAKGLTCPQCGVNRLKEPCPGMADECAMKADAHLLAAHPVAYLNSERYLKLRNQGEGVEFRDSNGQWRSDCPTGEQLDAILDNAHPVAGSPAESCGSVLRQILQDYFIPETEFNSVEFDAIYGRYTDLELAKDLLKRVIAAEPMPASEAASEQTFDSRSATGLLLRAKSAIEQSDAQRWSGLTLDIDRYFAAREVEPRAIYQILDKYIGAWCDVRQQDYNLAQSDKRRTVYAAPAAPTDAKQAMSEAWQVLMAAGVCPGTKPMSLADGIREAISAAQSVRDAAQPTAAPGKEA